MNQLLDDLKSLRELLAPAGRWCQDFFAKNAAGEDCHPSDEDATCFCIIGGCQKVTDTATPRITPRARNLISAIIAALPRTAASLACYNDGARRTHAQIMRLVDKAIKKETSYADRQTDASV